MFVFVAIWCLPELERWTVNAPGIQDSILIHVTFCPDSRHQLDVGIPILLPGDVHGLPGRVPQSAEGVPVPHH